MSLPHKAHLGYPKIFVSSKPSDVRPRQGYTVSFEVPWGAQAGQGVGQTVAALEAASHCHRVGEPGLAESLLQVSCACPVGAARVTEEKVLQDSAGGTREGLRFVTSQMPSCF